MVYLVAYTSVPFRIARIIGVPAAAELSALLSALATVSVRRPN